MVSNVERKSEILTNQNWKKVLWKGSEIAKRTMSEENQGSRSPLAIVKLLELGLAITCCYLHFYSFNDGDLVTGFLATGTFCGYVIILSATMAGLVFTDLMTFVTISYSRRNCRISNESWRQQANQYFLQLAGLCFVCSIWSFHHWGLGTSI